MTATTENQVSHKFVVTKGSKTVKPLLLSLIDLDFLSSYKSPRLGKFILCFKEPSQDMAMSCSCLQVVSPETMLAANWFLTHSYIETSTSLNYNGKFSCNEPKWLMKVFSHLLFRCWENKHLQKVHFCVSFLQYSYFCK
jgi:hypothetical protein